MTRRPFLKALSLVLAVPSLVLASLERQMQSGQEWGQLKRRVIASCGPRWKHPWGPALTPWNERVRWAPERETSYGDSDGISLRVLDEWGEVVWQAQRTRVWEEEIEVVEAKMGELLDAVPRRLRASFWPGRPQVATYGVYY